MKKTIISSLLLFVGFSFAFAGGIVTNTNQSAAWVRSLARDASVDVDAVFFNPAGLTHLEDGFYIQVNSQTIPQTRTITSDLATLNGAENGVKTYTGETFVPFLPTAYLAYKKGNLAFGAAFTVIGGGGSAEFKEGLPSFEAPISALPAGLAGLQEVGQAAGVDLSVTGYDADIYFNGTSAYLGFQAGVAYKINDMISIAAGARYVSAKNSYVGHIRNISVKTADGLVRADEFMTTKAVPTLNAVSANLTAVTQIPAGVQPIIDNGGGGLTLDAAQNLNVITAEQAAGIAAGVTVVGGDPTTLSIQQISDLITGATPTLQGKITALDANAAQLTATAATLNDKEVDVEQTGTGFTPYFGADFSLMDGALGISLKYELATKMEVTNATKKDDTGLYPNKEVIPAEIPSMLSIGVRYGADAFRIQTGVHLYGDKNAKYGKKGDDGKYVTNGEEVTVGGKKTTFLEGNLLEAALGLEYDINDMFTLSGGFLMTKTNPNDIFQSDLSYTLSTKTFGFGGAVNLNENFKIDLGASFTSYDNAEKTVTYSTGATAKETYDKVAKIFSIGLTYRIGGE